MYHTDDIIKAVAIDRQTRMPNPRHQFNHFGQGGTLGHGDNVGTRHHDVLDPRLAELEQVEQHHALFLVESGVVVALGDQRLHRLAQTVSLTADTRQRAEPASQHTEQRTLARRSGLVLPVTAHFTPTRSAAYGSAMPSVANTRTSIASMCRASSSS